MSATQNEGKKNSSILSVMQDRDRSWLLNYGGNTKKEHTEREQKQRIKDEGDNAFFAHLRETREQHHADFMADRREHEERMRTESPPIRPIPETPAALIQLKSVGPDAPALYGGPTTEQLRAARGPGIADEKGVLGFGLLGAVRKGLGLI